MKSEKNQSSEKLRDYETKINAYQSEYRIKESRYKFLVETDIKSVKHLMEAVEKNSNLSNGVHGVLANLISVDKQYETAIEMTLGGAIQNIVTNSEEEAKKLVNYLRDNKIRKSIIFTNKFC